MVDSDSGDDVSVASVKVGVGEGVSNGEVGVDIYISGVETDTGSCRFFNLLWSSGSDPAARSSKLEDIDRTSGFVVVG